MNSVHHHSPTRYTTVPTMYDTASQKSSVVWKSFLFASSDFAVATAAKHGIVVMLKAMKAMRPAGVMPVCCIMMTAALMPSASASAS